MSNTTSKRDSKLTMRKPTITQGLFFLLLISIIVYLLVRSVFIIYADYVVFEKILAVVFFLSEAFIMFHAFGYLGTIYRLNRSPETKEIQPLPRNDFPSVAIFIPARHESKEVLEATIMSCYNLAYPNKTIYLLDDSSLRQYKDEAQELARKYDVQIFRRTERHGAKAGIINDCTKMLSEKYIAIFDADQNPLPMFLSKLIPILEADPKLAFVQTPQFYSNTGTNRITLASNMQQAVFYEYVCEAKSSSQAMICCGTNVVLKRAALEDAGGFDESTVTEDFATSFALHAKGWKSLYNNQVNTYGMGPGDLDSYFTQQSRWAMGNVRVFRKVLSTLFRSPKTLRPLQWWEYLVSGSYYLTGWAYLFLFLCPVAYLFFNIPSFFMNPIVYTLTFIPYLMLSMAIFYNSMLSRRISIGQIIQGQLLSILTLPIYMKASLLGFLGVKGTFQITAKGRHKRASYAALWPQLLFWALNLAALTWGLNRFVYERTAAVLINGVWATYHCVLLSSIFYYNE
jgi:cellulose synthase (UDP-forming)